MLGQLEDGELADLIVKQALFLGILAIGLAAGAAIGLMRLQSACIDDGILPKPGAEVTEQAMFTATACWESAVFLQQIANYSAVAGAVLLLGGAVLERYPEKVTEVLTS